MPVKFTNNASATLASAITTSSTVITVTSGQGAFFPSLSAGDYFFATLTDSSNNLEVVRCTARTGDSLTVTRAQDGTAARAYAANDRIELRINAAAIDSKFDKEGGTVTGNLAVNGNTTLGDASGDSVTVNAATIALNNTPSISGNPTFTGNVTLGDAGTDTATIASQLSANASVGTSGQVLSSRGANLSPQWISQSAIAAGSATNATTSTNLAGGGAGQIPYQSASGTTAMLAAGTAGQVLVSNGTSAPSWGGVGGINGDVFTASGNWTKPTGVNAVRVTIVGGGGGGGSANGYNSGGKTPSIGTAYGGDGGAAPAVVAYLDITNASGSIAVTVGAAGTATTTNGNAGTASSFGSFATSNGGGGGTAANTNTVNTAIGADGADGTLTTTATEYWDFRPGSFGSSGAGAVSSGNTTVNGGNGGAGIVIVEW